MSDINAVAQATETAVEAAKEVSKFDKFNKFGWGFLAGAGTAAAAVGGFFGGRALIRKAKSKKASKSEPEANSNSEASNETEK